MAEFNLRVIKLGGSLLSASDLPSRWETWFEQQSLACNIVIVGGGAFAEAVRHYDDRLGLDLETAHWLAVDAMTFTAKVAGAKLRDLTPLANWKAFDRRRQGCNLLLDVRPFLLEEQSHAGRPLPKGWHVTSDSIAARLAEVLTADELVLLKSCTVPDVDSPESLAEGSFVDGWFPVASRGVPIVRIVSLLDCACPELRFHQRNEKSGGPKSAASSI